MFISLSINIRIDGSSVARSTILRNFSPKSLRPLVCVYVERLWFDVCKCNIPCPCEFAQAPTYEECDGILAYHIKKGNYGDIPLDDLNVLALGSFKGNIWTGDGLTRVNMAIFFDEKANEKQREALNMIFSRRAAGFMADFAKLIGEIRGIEYASIKFELADDLSYWSAEIPGKILA